MNKSDHTQADYLDLPRQPPGEKFLGDFYGDDYTLHKTYLPGQGKHLRLYHRKYTPQKAPVATLCIIHGFGEHSGRFTHIAEHFCSLGYEILMIDLRGFGFSGGARGAAVFEQLLKDVGVLISQANPALPLFLYGHSMGGLLVLSFTLLNPHTPIAGVVATSPLIGLPVDRNLTWFKLKILFTVSKDLEDLVMNSMVNPTALTKNNNFLQNAFGDRLMIPFLGVNMGASLLRATTQIKRNAGQFTKPLLILHGKQDSVTNYLDSIYFYENCQSSEKCLKLFENGYHELQHDEELDELKSVVTDWLSRRVPQSKPIGHLQPFIYNFPQKKRQSKLKVILILIAIIYLILLLKFKNRPQFKKVNPLLIPLLVLRK